MVARGSDGVNRRADALLGRDAAVREHHERVRCDAESRPGPGPGLIPSAGGRERIGHAEPDHIDLSALERLAEFVRHDGVVHRHAAGGQHDAAEHRPEVGDRPTESHDADGRSFRRHLGMIEDELGFVLPRAPPGQQARGAGVVQVRIVEHDEPGELKKVRPHEIVAACVPELVHDQVVGSLPAQPDEVVSEAGGEVPCAREGELGGRRDEHVDGVGREDARQHVDGVLSDAARHGRQRGEPGKPHGEDLTTSGRAKLGGAMRDELER